jgi:sigma-E factor negative regulatory protein RseB
MAGNIKTKTIVIGLAGLIGLMATATFVAARDKTSPEEWLQKMSSAVQTLDFEGTVIRRQNDDVQPLKIVHKKINGVINERIVVQEGNGLEVIRIGDEVHCILPGKQSVLIEHWENASTLFATLPSSTIDPGTQYHVLILARDQRVAGRSVVKLAIRPIDAFRFEHRFWLDQQTGFPLQTELIDQNGAVIDQLKFADIRIDTHINAQLLAPSMSLDNFTWYTDPGRKRQENIETDWFSDNLPAGFRVESTSEEMFGNPERAATHIVFSDGMAAVSVFISEMQENEIRQSSQRGASSSFSTEIEGYQITAVGEVPTATVKMIAESMRQR